MARDENPPWDLGQTYYNGGTIDPTNLDPGNLEGKEYVFEDRAHGTGLPLRVRVVRNTGLTNILPKQICKFDNAGFGYYVNGPTTVEDQYGFPAEEFLPPAGVPPNDLFYIVVFGPTLVLTPSSAGFAFAVGDNVVSITAATSGASDAGHVTDESADIPTGATTALTQGATGPMQNRIGRCMSAATTSMTNTGILIGVKF
jgi:hypothetical protein